MSQLTSLDAEQALLGAILYRSDVVFAVADKVLASDFSDPVHGHIYRVAHERVLSGQEAGPVVMAQALKDVEGLDDPSAYLHRLCADVPSTVAAPEYAQLIANLSVCRSLVGAGSSIIERARATDIEDDPREQIEEAVSALTDLSQGRDKSQSLSNQVTEWQNEVTALCRGEGRVGLKSGLRWWDQRTGGLRASELTIVGGRPGMGKSIIGTTMARAVAQQGRGVLLVSLEMASREVLARTAADLGAGQSFDLPYGDQLKGQLDAQQQKQLSHVAGEIARLPLQIDDRVGLTPEAVKLEAMKAARRFERAGTPLGLVVVDYLGLLRTKATSGNTFMDEGHKALALKEIAKTLDVAVVGLCQLSRQVEQREDKRPQLSDLKYSGDIEAHANNVSFVFRPEYYLERDPRRHLDPGLPEFSDWENEMGEVRGHLQVSTQKCRIGEVGDDAFLCDAGLSAIRVKPSQQARAA